MNKIKYGKLPPESLRNIIFKRLGSPNDNILLGPAIGEDAAVVKIKDNIIGLTTDPITGAYKDLGRLVVHINANDIATRGMKPVFLLVTLLLPQNFDLEKLKYIAEQMDAEAKKIGVAIVGGHTEFTPDIKNPIAVGFMVGEIVYNGYVTSGGAKVGDKLIMTKMAAIEGTAILAEDGEEFLRDRGLSEIEIQKAKEFKNWISVVKDGLTAMETGVVHAMHDPTEGGILGGICEIAEASKLGIRVYEKNIKISEITRKIANIFEINPYYLISSGTMLIAVEKGKESLVVERLKQNSIDASVIGEFIDSPDLILVKGDGSEESIEWPRQDELWEALEKCKGE